MDTRRQPPTSTSALSGASRRGRRKAAQFAAACGLVAAFSTGTSIAQGDPTRKLASSTQVVTLPAGQGLPATEVAIPVPTVYSPVLASKLISRPELDFKLGRLQWASYSVLFLMHQPSAKKPLPVAAISTFQVGNKEHVWFQWLVPAGRRAGQGRASQGDVEIATIEHLYALALQQNPEALFCLAARERSCARADDDYSHAQLLGELHGARQRILTSARRTGANVPWQLVSMVTVHQDSGDPDDVGVRVMSDGTPMEGARVFFNRAPHSICRAKSSANGVAACRLEDNHADGPHEDEDHAAVTAVYPGDVRPNIVLLPTTLVVRSANDSADQSKPVTSTPERR